MDICHLKNSELEAKHQKYKGRVVLRGDIVKDDSGSYAVFTEQGSSASQMTAAKVMDIISRLQGCAGQAADAVSAYTQVKMEDAPQITENSPIRNVQTFGFVYHDTNGQNHGPVWKTQSFLLSDILSGHPLAGQLWERQFEKILLMYGWEKVSNWECLLVHREKGLFLLVYVDDIKLAGKKQYHWSDEEKYSIKKLIWENQHLSLDHVYLGVYSKTMSNKQRYCGQLQSHVWITNFHGWNWNTTILGKSSYFFVVLRCGRSCQEMCGTIFWVAKQDDSTILQSIYSMHRWPSF